MLFDEKDLNVFENEEARDYFKEILQSYYGQNYRAAVVTLLPLMTSAEKQSVYH